MTSTLLSNITAEINRYFGIFIFIFGTIGNILNIFVLSQKNLRSNPCGWFFLMSSITCIAAYGSGLITRVLTGWNLDISAINQGLCKFRSIVSYTSMTITTWFIAIAAVDRWLSSSTITSRRQKSTIKNAHLATIILICTAFVVHIQMLVCFEANLVDTPQTCYGKSSECRLISDLSFAVATVLLPLIIMVIFSLMTVMQVRQAHHRVHNIPNDNSTGLKSSNLNKQQRQYKKVDRQLLLMLLFQVTLITVLSFPVSIFRFYLTFTIGISKSTLQKTTEDFAFSLFVLFFYLAIGISFYIYTLSGGSVFRKALKKIFIFK